MTPPDLSTLKGELETVAHRLRSPHSDFVARGAADVIGRAVIELDSPTQAVARLEAENQELKRLIPPERG